MLETKHSRLPVFRDQIDNVEGLIYVRDLLHCWTGNKADSSIAPFRAAVYFIPETKPLARLLEEMQKGARLSGDGDRRVRRHRRSGDCRRHPGRDRRGNRRRRQGRRRAGRDRGGRRRGYEVLGSTEMEIERLFGMEIEADDFTTIAAW